MSPYTFRQGLQRVGFLAYLPSVLGKFGVSKTEILAFAGLKPDALDDPEGTVPYKAMGLLLEEAAIRTGCAHLGLEVGRYIGLASLGVVGELMRNAPTLGNALFDFASHQIRNAHGGAAYLIVDQHSAYFGYAIYETEVAGHTVICDGAALAALRIITELAGSEVVSHLEVHLSRAVPADVTPYQLSFQIPIHFEAEHTAVVLPRSCLDLPIQGASSVLRKKLATQLLGVWYSGEADLLTLLRRELRVALLRGDVSLETVSKRLGMSARTLQRRLKEQDVDFQDVLGEGRLEFAQQLLKNTRLRVGEIGSIVGYAHPSVLARNFSRWAGMTPSEWRRCN